MRLPFTHQTGITLVAVLALSNGYSSVAWAQEGLHLVPNPNRKTVQTQPASPFDEIKSIDPAAKTITLQSHQPKPEPVRLNTPLGPITLDVGTNALESVPFAPDALIVRRQHALKADMLGVGDIVTLLGQKATANTLKLVVPPGMENRLHRTGEARYSSKAEFFTVISLNPLVLRKGQAPTHNEEVVNLPFTNGPASAPIGTMSVASNPAMPRALAETGPQGEVNVPVFTGDVSITLTLTNTQDVEFDKFTNLTLSEVAAEFAAQTITVTPEYEFNNQGKRQVKRLIVNG